jgi:hypothetical protein
VADAICAGGFVAAIGLPVGFFVLPQNDSVSAEPADLADMMKASAG